MKRFALFLALSTICMASPGSAQSQSDLTINAAASSARAETALSSALRQLPATPALVASQRAWAAYRDAECRYAHHATPAGSMYGMETAMCREAMARQRLAVLRRNIAEGYGAE